MEIGGTMQMDKELAGKAIIDSCTAMMGAESAYLGRYRGFDMTVYYDSLKNQYRLSLKGTLSHAITLGGDILGNITRMDNALANIAGEVELLRAEIADNQEQMERARADMEAPFSKEDELTQKTARLKQLNILLNMDQKDKNMMEDTRTEDTPEKRKVREAIR